MIEVKGGKGTEIMMEMIANKKKTSAARIEAGLIWGLGLKHDGTYGL